MTKTNPPPERKHFLEFDIVRAMAIIMVVIYHYLQEFFGSSFLIIPDGIYTNWSRLNIFWGQGVWGFFKNIFAGIFAYGFSAVHVFLILSGFVLTWSALNSKAEAKTNWLQFYWKKMKRILVPFYISLLIGVLLLSFRNSVFPAFSWWPNYGWVDFLKYLIPIFLFFDTTLLQQMEGGYWFIPLILQLYLIFPMLFWLMKKVGNRNFLLIMAGLTLSYRLIATFGYEWLLSKDINWPWLDTAPMGVLHGQNGYFGFCFFLPRLLEFAFGMALASWEFQKNNLIKKFSGNKMLFISILTTLLGFGLDYYQAGWIISDPIIAIGLFSLMLNIAERIKKTILLSKALKSVGDSSYETFLLHHYFLAFVLMPTLIVTNLKNEWSFWIMLPIYLVIVLLLGKLGNHLSQKTDNLIQKYLKI